jgi:hypothetical protein
MKQLLCITFISFCLTGAANGAGSKGGCVVVVAGEESIWELSLRRVEAQRSRNLTLQHSVELQNRNFYSLQRGAEEIDILRNEGDPSRKREILVVRRLVALDKALQDVETLLPDYSLGNLSENKADEFLAKVKIIRSFTFSAYLVFLPNRGEIETSFDEFRSISFQRVINLSKAVMLKTGLQSVSNVEVLPAKPYGQLSDDLLSSYLIRELQLIQAAP